MPDRLVDNDPVVLAHARALLTGANPGTTDYIEVDVRPRERWTSIGPQR